MGTYSTDVAALDVLLDMKLSDLRHAQDRRDVSCSEAADIRVALLAEHLGAIRLLRVQYFGTNADVATEQIIQQVRDIGGER